MELPALFFPGRLGMEIQRGKGNRDMKIVIVGDGKVGITLTQQLAREGHDIVIIDKDLKVLRETVDHYDVMGIHGNGASLTVQREAGVGESDLLIAATSADEVNILCCILARRLGVKRTIARVRDPEYNDQLFFLKEDLGLSMTINPERAAALEILNLLRFPAALKRDTFAKGRVEIIAIKLHPDSILCGKYLHELSYLTKVQVLVCAVERDGSVSIPTGSFRLQAGDDVYVTGSSHNLGLLARKLDLADRKIKSVMMIGGSRVAYYLSRTLIEDGVKVKVIEIDPARCERLADLLPKASIVNADGAQPEVLLSEGIASADALITLTDIDEENIILSLYGKNMGVYKTITKINRIEYGELAQQMGVESTISPKDLVCHNIVRYVRALGNSGEETGLVALHRIVNDQVEALEFAVTEDTPNLGVPLRDMQLKPGVLIACINREGKVIIPNGNDYIQPQDQCDCGHHR